MNQVDAAHVPNAELPIVLAEQDVVKLLPDIDVIGALERMFAGLANKLAVQPRQTLTVFPEGRGDFITYLGAMNADNIFGAKLSPYLVGEEKPIVTAWTCLFSMTSGKPLMWCDASLLTVERTAGTTALAVRHLARAESTRLAVMGSGAAAQAHIRHAASVRPWSRISVYSPGLAGNSAKGDALRALDSRVRIAETISQCVEEADAVLLCTSSGTPVFDPATLSRPALITSISTNVARAHEIAPALLANMEVYCDYRATTPTSAGEMLIAAEQHGWNAAHLKGDLPELIAGSCEQPSDTRHIFFRSIGLGLEDMAIAAAVYESARSRFTHICPPKRE